MSKKYDLIHNFCGEREKIIINIHFILNCGFLCENMYALIYWGNISQ